MEDIDEVLKEQGLSKDNLEAGLFISLFLSLAAYPQPPLP